MDKNPRDDTPSRNITDESAYMNRRMFMQTGIFVGAVAATAGIYYALTGGQRRRVSTAGLESLPTTLPAALPTTAADGQGLAPAPLTRAERIAAGYYTAEPQTPFDTVAGYNNFYEFSTGKEEVAELAKDFVTTPWKVQVGGLASKPRTFDLDDLKKFGLEERVYRHRCVEAWSMVVPWLGFPLGSLLKAVEPLSDAKYVRFVTLLDKKQMPGQESSILNWPYEEGLRMDEAMHPLAILSLGLYGKTLPPQNGAPVRLVVPWKYGFKGIKSIVKIELVREQPKNSWNEYAANEYGFYSNVNPEVPHPRWSQDQERRFNKDGGIDVIPTQKFNGYGAQVASLYAGMDLAKYY